MISSGLHIVSTRLTLILRHVFQMQERTEVLTAPPKEKSKNADQNIKECICYYVDCLAQENTSNTKSQMKPGALSVKSNTEITSSPGEVSVHVRPAGLRDQDATPGGCPHGRSNSTQLGSEALPLHCKSKREASLHSTLLPAHTNPHPCGWEGGDNGTHLP